MIFLGKLPTVVGVAMLSVVGALAQTEDTVGQAILEAIKQTAQLQLELSEVNSTNFHSEGPVSYSMTRAVHLLTIKCPLIRQ